MAEFTKEQLIAEVHYNLEHCFCSEKTKRIMEIALAALTASMEQEPVAYMHIDGDDFEYNGHNEFSGGGKGVPLYAAPQLPQLAPVMQVPDEWTIQDAVKFCKQTGRQDAGSAMDAWNSCRAAMLHGGELVTTAYKLPFEQWLSQQTGTIDVDCGCVTTEAFYHWLRVAYEDGNSPATPDGSKEALSEAVSAIYFDDSSDYCSALWSVVRAISPKIAELLESNERAAFDATQLPAAPQQEAVSSALEHGMARYSGAMQKLADGGD